VTSQFALVVAPRVIDVVRYDKDGVEGEFGVTRALGAEEDDRAAAEIAQLGRTELRVLEAAGVVEAIAEDERVGVVETTVRDLVGPEGAMDPATMGSSPRKSAIPSRRIRPEGDVPIKASLILKRVHGTGFIRPLHRSPTG